MNIYNCCCLCLEEDKYNGDNLIWIDGMQLCESCYKTYTDNDYNKQIMPLNAIKRYRRKIAELEERIEKNFKTLCKYEDTLEHYEYEVFKDNTIDLSKLKELDEIGIEGKKYISKDKIKAKIKYWNKRLVEDERTDFIVKDKIIINVLEELLEELFKERDY